MKVYGIALFLFIFSCVTGAIDEMAIFSTPISYTGLEMNETIVFEVQEITETHTTWLFWIPMLLYKFVQILFSAFSTAVTIIPMFSHYGVPLEVCLMIQTPIWLVYAIGIIQFIVGRSTKAID